MRFNEKSEITLKNIKYTWSGDRGGAEVGDVGDSKMLSWYQLVISSSAKKLQPYKKLKRPNCFIVKGLLELIVQKPMIIKNKTEETFVHKKAVQ